MKSPAFHIGMICLYVAIMVGMVALYYGPVGNLLSRISCESIEDGGNSSPQHPKSLDQLYSDSNAYIRGTLRGLAVKVFLILIFSFLAVSVLVQVALVSASLSVRRLVGYMARIKSDGGPDGAKKGKIPVGRGDKLYPVYSQLHDLMESWLGRKAKLKALAGELKRVAADMRDPARKADAEALRTKAEEIEKQIDLMNS